MAESWQNDSRFRLLSERTIALRQIVIDKLLWFCREKGFLRFGDVEAKAFLAHVATGHTHDGGRWGNGKGTTPPRPWTAFRYFNETRMLLDYAVQQDMLENNPLAELKPPQIRKDQIVPFTADQIESLLNAAEKSKSPKRNKAILLFLLDTGVRASELCDLRLENLDLQGMHAEVLGKGNKRREVYFNPEVGRALWAYLRQDEREPTDPVFLCENGPGAGGPMTRNGLDQLLKRLGKEAGLTAVRCSPHTFRHTFAVEYLRAGGDALSLQRRLGHTTLAMTNNYVALAGADLAEKHRMHSPAARFLGRKGSKR
ncbi:MAG TPA: tyrosine-type recombinase/integrase [Armatimonadota bacterium]|nr:tyrosine-type recombinase/integrase [Armatimonadota bacterium]